MYLLVYNFFRFHHNRFRDTISCGCIVEDDCVRSCLIELQSFPLSRLYIDPHTLYLGAFSTFACTMQDVAWSNQALADRCDSYAWEFTTVKNTVCLSLLEFCPPAIYLEFVMECTLTAHLIWNMYSKKLFGINTLSCSVGSMGLRPEWPLKSSEVENFSSWRISTVLKSFLVASAPAILFFHTTSDQYCEYSNLFRRSSFSLQNSIAPSSSRDNSPSRRKVFILFATGYAWSNWAPGSTSIHDFSRISTSLEDEQVVEGLLGFVLAFDRLANANTSVIVVEVSCSLSSYYLSINSVTNLFRPWENSDPRVRVVVVHRFNFWFPLHVYLASNWLWLPIRVQFWCSLESNLSGQLIFHLVVKYTHDKSMAQQIVRTRQCVLSWSIVPTSTVFKNPAPVQIFINWSGCGSFSTRSSCVCNRFSCARVSIVVTNKSAGAKCGSDCSATTCLPVLVRQLLYSSQIWDCSVDTELIDRNDCAKNSFNRTTIGTEVYR